jgi:homoserine O-acetyltransferase
MRRVLVLALCWTLGSMTPLSGQAPQADAHRRSYALGSFTLESGVVLPGATIAYATFGTLNRERTNVILAPSWYGSDHHGYDFLIGDGLALDPAENFIVATEMFSSGFSSSPSNTPEPFHGPRFPGISIRDNVEAAHRLLESLGITHVRAVVGFSMGAEQAFQWAVSHPGFADRIVAYCGTAKTYPHGVLRLESAVAALTADPAFREGNYSEPPKQGFAAWGLHWATWVLSQEWWRRELYKPLSAEQMVNQITAGLSARDANDYIAQARTWQRHNIGETAGFGGSVEAALRSIRVPVLYMPSATDLYFPLGDAEYERQFLEKVEFLPIPSLWGHRAGSGRNPVDNAFLNAAIRRFLHQ